MKRKTVKFRELRRFLEKHNFEMRNAVGSHRVFVRPDDPTLLIFPPLKPNDNVPASSLAAAARLLDERGIVSRDDFHSALDPSSSREGVRT